MNQETPSRILPPLDVDGYSLSDPPPVAFVSTAPPVEPAPLPAPSNPQPAKGVLGGLLGRFKSKAPSVPAPADTSPSTPNASDASAGAPAPSPKQINLRGRSRPKRSWIQDLPAWGVSTIIHLTIFCVLAMATFAPQIHEAIAKSIDSAPFSAEIAAEQADEMMHILATPEEGPRDEAVGPMAATEFGPAGGSYGLGSGTGAPSATPSLRGRGAGSAGGVGENSLPNVKVSPLPPALRPLMPGTLSHDNGHGGKIRGDVTGVVDNYGEALDQLAREILRMLQNHRVTVVWLFDESGSMRDDQQAIKEKFDHAASALKDNASADMAGALNHVIVGFGADLHVELPKPTPDIDLIGKAIDRLAIDESGTENTMGALQSVIRNYSGLVTKDRRVMIVLVTDESGDDGAEVEEARQLARHNDIPIYVIGRQSVFGYETIHLRYTDPVTKDEYWPAIRRGPETPAPESLQYDGLHDRWDEQAAGFPPYELARLVKDTGGIYFLLPSEEGTRVRQREKAYNMETLKEYVPGYESRVEYIQKRQNSALRQPLFEIVEMTRSREPDTTFLHRREFPVEEGALVEAMIQEAPNVQGRLRLLVDIEKKLRALKPQRDREQDKRWQAHYDLILAQIVAYQVKAYEYLACMDEMVDLGKKGQLKPSRQPIPGQLDVVWYLEHSTNRKAPKGETDAKYEEATKLLNEVVSRHPNTPWADLAADELRRGLGVDRHEWARSASYGERARLVPKY